jgi:hypothetical protein
MQEGQPVNLMEHRHPNILKFDNEGRLYVGDSVGTVHVWDLNVIIFVFKVLTEY